MESKSKVLWLDVDGVLLDWSRPFLEYIKSPVSYDQLTQYDLSSLFDGNVQVMVDKINEFNKTRRYSSLQPLVSQEDLVKLKKKGYELRVITQCDGNTARLFRVQNLTNVFGGMMFTTIRFTKRGEKKAETLRKLEPYDEITVVEDNPGFFLDAERVGGFKSLAIRHPYNAKELKDIREFCTGIPIYSGMAELVRSLCAD